MSTVAAPPETANSSPANISCSQEAGQICFPLSFAQEGLWFLEQFAPGNAAYNMPEGWWLEGELDWDALQASFDAIVARHETLRTRFDNREGYPVQVIEPAGRFPLTFKDLRQEKEPDTEAVRLAKEEAQRGFDLKNGCLARALVIRTSQTKHLLVLNLHHIICDAWSVGVLLK